MSELLFDWHLFQVIFLVILSVLVKPLPLPLYFWQFLWLSPSLRKSSRVGAYWAPVLLFILNFSAVDLKSQGHIYCIFLPLILCGSFLAFEIYENKYNSTFYTFSKLFLKICLCLPHYFLFIIGKVVFLFWLPYMSLSNPYATWNIYFFKIYDI